MPAPSLECAGVWAAACPLPTVCLGQAAARGSEAGGGEGIRAVSSPPPQGRAKPSSVGLLPLLQAIK